MPAITTWARWGGTNDKYLFENSFQRMGVLTLKTVHEAKILPKLLIFQTYLLHKTRHFTHELSELLSSHFLTVEGEEVWLEVINSLVGKEKTIHKHCQNTICYSTNINEKNKTLLFLSNFNTKLVYILHVWSRVLHGSNPNPHWKFAYVQFSSPLTGLLLWDKFICFFIAQYELVTWKYYAVLPLPLNSLNECSLLICTILTNLLLFIFNMYLVINSTLFNDILACTWLHNMIRSLKGKSSRPKFILKNHSFCRFLKTIAEQDFKELLILQHTVEQVINM